MLNKTRFIVWICLSENTLQVFVVVYQSDNKNMEGKMNLKVMFFDDRLVDAIGAGIYEIYLKKDNKEELLYVGESVFVLVRCATHLYEIKKGKGYLGFTNEIIDNKNITLVFKLLEVESDKQKRKSREKDIIKQKCPKLQSGISDRVKTIENMIEEITKCLTSNT